MAYDFYTVKTLSPCKDCVNRHSACHDTCKEYNAFKKQLDKARNEERERKRWDRIINEKPMKKRRRTS